MENTKLISMVEFIKDQEKIIPYENTGTLADADRTFVRRIISYQRFLSTPLSLGQFVPCTLEGAPLEEPAPTNWNNFYTNSKGTFHRNVSYKEALERVIFEGFKLSNTRGYPTVKSSCLSFIFDEHGCWLEAFDSVDGQRINTLERLTQLNLSDRLTLTPSALKEIFK